MVNSTHPADPDRDWSGYNGAQQGRRPRALVESALAVAGAGRGRTAIELGSGVGIEAQALAEAGWQVHTFDGDPSVVTAMKELSERWPIVHTTADLAGIESLPSAELVFSSVGLPFVPRQAFPGLWKAIGEALQPGAVLAVDFFGDRDEWAHGPGTYLCREEVDALLCDFDVVDLREQEFDGSAYSGPKHWHLFTVLARSPADWSHGAIQDLRPR